MGLVDCIFYLAWAISVFWGVFNCRNCWSIIKKAVTFGLIKLQATACPNKSHCKTEFLCTLKNCLCNCTSIIIITMLYLLKCSQNLISKENTPYTFQTQDNTTIRLDNHFLSGDIDWTFINQSSNNPSDQTNQLLIIVIIRKIVISIWIECIFNCV